jgi:hypothetical protein
MAISGWYDHQVGHAGAAVNAMRATSNDAATASLGRLVIVYD